MKISAVSIKNIKRIRDVEIRPASDRAVVLIAGENAQGKSSILDALTMAFGGKSTIPPDPVHHGAEDGEIKIELGDGKLTIRRTIDPDGGSALEVRDELGALKSPQAVLDKLVAGRFLDPLAFRMLKPADQRAELLRLVDKDGKVAELDARRERVFDRRTELGRDLRKISAQVDGMVAVDPAAPVDVAALVAELNDLHAKVNAVNALRRREVEAERERDLANRHTALALAELERAKAEHATACAEESEAIGAHLAARDAVKAAPTLDGYQARTVEIQAEIRRAGEHNEGVARIKAAEQQRLHLLTGRDKLAADVAKLGEELATIDTIKAGVLAVAALPVPGLGVSPTAVTLDGVPLSQASGAEQLRVALGVAIAANPNLRDVWIKDGALLDDTSLAAVAEYAAAKDCRVWVERVGTRDPGAIVIHDGRVVEAPATNGAQRSLFE